MAGDGKLNLIVGVRNTHHKDSLWKARWPSPIWGRSWHIWQTLIIGMLLQKSGRRKNAQKMVVCYLSAKFLTHPSPKQGVLQQKVLEVFDTRCFSSFLKLIAGGFCYMFFRMIFFDFPKNLSGGWTRSLFLENTSAVWQIWWTTHRTKVETTM